MGSRDSKLRLPTCGVGVIPVSNGAQHASNELAMFVTRRVDFSASHVCRLAELSDSEKDAISHRGRAARELLAWLRAG